MRFSQNKKYYITFIICQSLVAICLGLLLYSKTIKYPEEFYLFGHVFRSAAIFLLVAIGFIEWVMLILFACFRKRFIRLLWSIVIIPILIVESFLGLLGEYDSSSKQNIPGFDKPFIIANSGFLSAESYLFQQTGLFKAKVMAQAGAAHTSYGPLQRAEFSLVDDQVYAYSIREDRTYVFDIIDGELSYSPVETFNGKTKEESESAFTETAETPVEPVVEETEESALPSETEMVVDYGPYYQLNDGQYPINGWSVEYEEYPLLLLYYDGTFLFYYYPEMEEPFHGVYSRTEESLTLYYNFYDYPTVNAEEFPEVNEVEFIRLDAYHMQFKEIRGEWFVPDTEEIPYSKGTILTDFYSLYNG